MVIALEQYEQVATSESEEKNNTLAVVGIHECLCYLGNWKLIKRTDKYDAVLH